MESADLGKASLFGSSSWQYQSQSGADLYRHEEIEEDDELKTEYLCPFCADEFDVVGLCCHIDEEHPVCPLCAKRVGADLVSHITTQHRSFLLIIYIYTFNLIIVSHIFVSTVDPLKEPPLVTANTVLSILAVDYPVDKVSCYVSDNGATMLTFEALSETSEFARKLINLGQSLTKVTIRKYILFTIDFPKFQI
ncbi:hypothetical protein UlMin_042796 [Ulmus minor]